MSQPLVLIMAGGTGGHVYPALAVAKALEESGARVVWIGTRLGLEAKVVAEVGIAMHSLTVSGLRGKGLLAWLLAPIRLLLALLQALRIIASQKPDLVLGMGGFATGPGGVAAWLLRRPLVIHEQNAVAGLTNRWLSRLATQVLEAFPNSFASLRSSVVTGNPVRRDILAIAVPEKRWTDRDGPARLLVMGGSQGALSLNQIVPAAVGQLVKEQCPLIRHQTGASTFDKAKAAYAEHGVAAELNEFIEDMAGAYAWADLVIARAGALTVAELAAAGLGAVLVPYPSAVDDHQTLNAKYLAGANAAVLLPESDLTPERLARELKRLLTRRSDLLGMATRARALARPAATRDISNICLRLAGAEAAS